MTALTIAQHTIKLIKTLWELKCIFYVFKYVIAAWLRHRFIKVRVRRLRQHYWNSGSCFHLSQWPLYDIHIDKHLTVNIWLYLLFSVIHCTCYNAFRRQHVARKETIGETKCACINNHYWWHKDGVSARSV